jgi:hypothetical protein
MVSTADNVASVNHQHKRGRTYVPTAAFQLLYRNGKCAAAGVAAGAHVHFSNASNQINHTFAFSACSVLALIRTSVV